MRYSIVLLAALSLAGCGKKAPPVAAAAPQPQTEASAAPGANPLEGGPQAISESPKVRVKRVMADAVSRLQAGDVSSAPKIVEDLKGITALAPDRAEIPFNIGVAYELMGDDTNARKAYLRATDVDPKLGAAWLNLGSMAERAGDLDRALQNYQAGLRYAPDDGNLIVGVIGVLRRQGRFEEAISQAKQALGQNAHNINVYNNLGLVYLDQGQTDLASFTYQKALNSIEGADQNASLHCNLGKVHLARGEAFTARQELERALQLDPNLNAAKVLLAQLDMDDHNWTDAASLLEGALAQDPQDTGILTNLGICYRGLGRYEEAQARYTKALEIQPGDPTPYLDIAVLQGDYMRSYDAALASIDRYVAAGGKRMDLATQWRADLVSAKDKYEKELERKRKRDERDKKRAEQERLASEYDRIQQAKEQAAQAALNKACPVAGCPELTACNRQNLCVDEGAPGTAVAGQACQSDDDCAFGLACGADATCASGAAAPPAAPAPTVTPPPAPADPQPKNTPDPWGGQQ